MNFALFFEGTGQGVHGNKTNVSLAYEACVADAEQRLHLESGPGTNFGYYLSGTAAGYDWRRIFASARRWFEANYKSRVEAEEPKVFLFGFSRGALIARHFAAWLDKLSVEVEYLGLWDTVDATPGLEVSENCPGNVRFARHAVAEHEARRFFAYVPLRGERVEEELFPGVHSDVGGLYEDNHSLADIARAWVLEPAAKQGLRLKAEVNLHPRVDLKTAIRHDSRRLLSNLFGLLRPLRRRFPATIKRHALTDSLTLTVASENQFSEQPVAEGVNKFCSVYNHGRHGNASSRGTERAVKKRLRPQSHPLPTSKSSVIGVWTGGQRMARRSHSCCFPCPAKAGFRVFRGKIPHTFCSHPVADRKMIGFSVE